MTRGHDLDPASLPVAEWRADHEVFWRSAEHREALGGLGVAVDDDTPVVLSRVRLLRRL